MMDLLQRFIQNWHEKHYAPAGKSILLAVSGGMDSMVMAHLFFKAGMRFAIGHCNFRLRGREADLDTQLVADWAKAHDITFHHTYFDTQQKSEEWKKGIQETARILRYEWLDAIRKEHHYACIATAHHANDNAETLLMNLFKGTGMAGLHAIPERSATIIRPLLFAGKQELAAYAAANDVPYREDASNASDYYLRNAVRLNIIPAAEQLFPSLVQNLNNSIARFTEAEMLYKKAVDRERKQLLEQRGADWYIPVLKLQKRQPLNTICYELFAPFGFTPAQVPHIAGLLLSETGHYIDSNTHRVLRNRDFLVITALQAADTDLILIEGAPCVVHTARYTFRFSIQKKPASISSNPSIAYLDAKNIVFPIQLRRWKTGDYFYPLGMGMKKKKLSKYFIDQKIPLHEKEQAWVIECQKRIAWIAGMRLDERFKVKDSTEQILAVEMTGN